MRILTLLNTALVPHIVAAAASLAVMGGATVYVTDAALDRTASVDDNTWDTGTLILTENSGGEAMFDASDIDPANYNEEHCITVTYDGSITPADVRLYADSDGELASDLQVTVERSDDPAAFSPDCADFTGGDEVYSGTLDGLPEDFDTGVGEWTADSEGDERGYRFSVELDDGSEDLYGQSATAAFIWETQTQ